MKTPSRSPVILIVDADNYMIEALQIVLDLAEYQVAVAMKGQEALQIVQTSPPDLILADIRLPDISGLDLLQALQEDERTRSIPVIFLTADTEPSLHHRGLALGARSYLTKPFDIDYLLGVVGSVFQ